MRTRDKVSVVAAGFAAALVGIGVLLGGCGSDPQPMNGEKIAADRQVYTPKNDVEGKNYNGRQRLADDPATLLWCTVYPTSPNAKAFTVPIVGKLTSGNKRPYATSRVFIDSDTTGREYSPEVAGPDGFYGSSGEYRFGFDPAGNYHDFYSMETYCTNVPTIVQKETTTIAITGTGDLTALDRRTQDALRECQRKNPDLTKPCPAAAAILGVG